MTKRDFTVYYPLYDGKHYNTVAYSFQDTTDYRTFNKECYLTKEECEEKCKTLNMLEDMARVAADNYVGHSKESGEDLAISMQRDGFINGAHWVFDNFNVKL